MPIPDIWAISEVVNKMDHTVNPEAVGTIPWTWHIFIYTISMMGLGNVAMCSWLPVKLRTASIVYHGFFLLVYVFNMIICLVKLQLSGPLNLMTGKLIHSVVVICGSSLCAANLWATLIKRPQVCFQNWAKYIAGKKKNKKQCFVLFTAPSVMILLAITSCYYHADLMLTNSQTVMNYLLPFLTFGKEVQQTMFWIAVIIREMIMLASSLYSALVCCIMVEIYVCVAALHLELLTICKKQHIRQSDLQIWRRQFGYLKIVLRSTNGYLGGSVLTLLILSVSILILAIFQPIGEENIELGLVLPICNTIVAIAALTVPSAILNGKVSKRSSSYVLGWNVFGTDSSVIGYGYYYQQNIKWNKS